jgi:hypothetical protein
MDMDSGLEKCKLNKKLKDCTHRAFQLVVWVQEIDWNVG